MIQILASEVEAKKKKKIWKVGWSDLVWDISGSWQNLDFYQFGGNINEKRKNDPKTMTN